MLPYQNIKEINWKSIEIPKILTLNFSKFRKYWVEFGGGGLRGNPPTAKGGSKNHQYAGAYGRASLASWEDLRAIWPQPVEGARQRNWGQQISSLGSQPPLPARYDADQSEMTRVFDRGRIKDMGPTFRSTQKTLLRACHRKKIIPEAPPGPANQNNWASTKQLFWDDFEPSRSEFSR